jgi:hypothetical protein
MIYNSLDCQRYSSEFILGAHHFYFTLASYTPLCDTCRERIFMRYDCVDEQHRGYLCAAQSNIMDWPTFCKAKEIETNLFSGSQVVPSGVTPVVYGTLVSVGGVVNEDQQTRINRFFGSGGGGVIIGGISGGNTFGVSGSSGGGGGGGSGGL